MLPFLLLAACARIEIEPTGRIFNARAIPVSLELVGGYDLPRIGSYALIEFRTDRRIEDANRFVGVFGPFLRLRSCTSGTVYDSWNVYETSNGNGKLYFAVALLPLEDSFARRPNPYVPIELPTDPDDTCLHLFGASMAGTSLSSNRVPFDPRRIDPDYPM